mmetsp:Transcript_3105/g.6229  ORF Transcript_3105/g.6229 Transcript_3105/m.6229 type:complete len:235 (-) Transcript_3105:371-1075(-)
MTVVEPRFRELYWRNSAVHGSSIGSTCTRARACTCIILPVLPKEKGVLDGVTGMDPKFFAKQGKSSIVLVAYRIQGVSEHCNAGQQEKSQQASHAHQASQPSPLWQLFTVFIALVKERQDVLVARPVAVLLILFLGISFVLSFVDIRVFLHVVKLVFEGIILAVTVAVGIVVDVVVIRFGRFWLGRLLTNVSGIKVVTGFLSLLLLVLVLRLLLWLLVLRWLRSRPRLVSYSYS